MNRKDLEKINKIVKPKEFTGFDMEIEIQELTPEQSKELDEIYSKYKKEDNNE